MTNAHTHNAVIERLISKLEAAKSPTHSVHGDNGALQCLYDIDSAQMVLETLIDGFVDLAESAVDEASCITRVFADKMKPICTIDAETIRDHLTELFADQTFDAKDWAEEAISEAA